MSPTDCRFSSVFLFTKIKVLSSGCEIVPDNLATINTDVGGVTDARKILKRYIHKIDQCHLVSLSLKKQH